VAFKVEHSSDRNFCNIWKLPSIPRMSHGLGDLPWTNIAFHRYGIMIRPNDLSILGTSGYPANQPMRSLMSSSNEQPIHRCKKIRPKSKHRPIHLSPDYHSDRHADWSSTFSAEEAVYQHSQSRDSYVTNLLQFAKPTSHPVKKHINIV